MLTDESNFAGVWYQIGYYRIPGDACVARAYTQRKIDSGQRFDQTGPCLTSGTQYQFRLEKLHDDLGYYWRASIIRWSDSVLIWDAPGDPSSSSPGFTIADGEYQYEVINERDQSGGGNASRAKLASAYYWDANFNALPADMSGGELHCDDCDPFGPYNTNWLNTRTFEDWTDGF
jgi:hypothetical protein